MKFKCPIKYSWIIFFSYTQFMLSCRLKRGQMLPPPLFFYSHVKLTGQVDLMLKLNKTISGEVFVWPTLYLPPQRGLGAKGRLPKMYPNGIVIILNRSCLRDSQQKTTRTLLCPPEHRKSISHMERALPVPRNKKTSLSPEIGTFRKKKL